jgi:glutamate synthase domain-containing protein 2
VVKYVDAVEVRIVVAAVLAAAADVVFVALHLPKLGGKKGGGGALPQQVINNSAAIQ